MAPYDLVKELLVATGAVTVLVDHPRRRVLLAR